MFDRLCQHGIHAVVFNLCVVRAAAGLLPATARLASSQLSNIVNDCDGVGRRLGESGVEMQDGGVLKWFRWTWQPVRTSTGTGQKSV